MIDHRQPRARCNATEDRLDDLGLIPQGEGDLDHHDLRAEIAARSIGSSAEVLNAERLAL